MKTMKNNINQESPIETISVKNDFEWFGYEGDSYEDFDSLESPIENVDIQKLDLEEIDKFVDNGDYMGFQDYLDALDDDQKHEALEYVENNYALCEENCDFTGYDPNTKKALCSCQLKINLVLSEINIDKKRLVLIILKILKIL